MLLYLDTNHISSVVRHPEAKASIALREQISIGRVTLALSLHHAIELSAPTFRHRCEVGDLLDEARIVWALPLPKLFDAEIAAAHELSLTGQRRQVRAFYPRLGDAWGMPQEVVPRPSGVLEALATNASLREGQMEQSAESVALDHMKRAAAVYRDPLEPLRGMISDRRIRQTASGLVLPAEYPPADIIGRAGGLAGFPAYEVYNVLQRHRFGDEQFPASPNDMVDEWHAAHAPYVDIIALDRRTAARLRGANVASSGKVASTLDEVMERLTRDSAA